MADTENDTTVTEADQAVPVEAAEAAPIAEPASITDTPPCPICGGPFHYQDLGLEPEDLPQFVARLSAVAMAADLPQDPTTESCPDCVGLGKVATGSLIPDQLTRSCTKCTGAGFVTKAITY